jgi:hypothetical protein
MKKACAIFKRFSLYRLMIAFLAIVWLTVTIMNYITESVTTAIVLYDYIGEIEYLNVFFSNRYIMVY